MYINFGITFQLGPWMSLLLQSHTYSILHDILHDIYNKQPFGNHIIGDNLQQNSHLCAKCAVNLWTESGDNVTLLLTLTL